MWRTLVIILVMCGGVAWFLSGGAPQRSGTLILQPAPGFPKEAQAELGRTVARFVAQCPAFATLGGELSFTDLQKNANTTRITFAVPEKSMAAQHFGPFAGPCNYDVTEEVLRLEGGEACQAVCLGKKPEQPAAVLEVTLPVPVQDQSAAPTAPKP